MIAQPVIFYLITKGCPASVIQYLWYEDEYIWVNEVIQTCFVDVTYHIQAYLTFSITILHTLPYIYVFIQNKSRRAQTMCKNRKRTCYSDHLVTNLCTYLYEHSEILCDYLYLLCLAHIFTVHCTLHQRNI